MNLETTAAPAKNLNSAAFSALPQSETHGLLSDKSKELARDFTQDLYQSVVVQSREIAERTIRFVRKNPVVSAVAAVSIGYLVARMMRGTPSVDKAKSNEPFGLHGDKARPVARH